MKLIKLCLGEHIVAILFPTHLEPISGGIGGRLSAIWDDYILSPVRKGDNEAWGEDSRSLSSEEGYLYEEEVHVVDVINLFQFGLMYFHDL